MRWLVCLGFPAGLLFALFSSSWYHRTAALPFGISKQEATAYARIFDVRQKSRTKQQPEAWTLVLGKHTGKKKRKGLSDADWRAASFSAEGFTDSVEVRRHTDVRDGWEIRFDKKNYFKAQRRLLLLPVNAATDEADEAAGIAEALGLAVPKRDRVEVGIDGQRGTYVAQEYIDEVFLDKRGLTDAMLFTQGFGTLHPEHWRPDTDGDSAFAEEILFKEKAVMEGTGDLTALIDLDAAAAWLVMCDVERRSDAILGESTFAYDRTTGRVIPLYAPRRSDDRWREAGTPVPNMFSSLLARPDFRERMDRLRKKAAEQRSVQVGLWFMLTQQGDLSWLTDGLPRQIATPAVTEGALAVRAVSLSTIGERLGAATSGDTIRFVRGKYNISEDLITPPNSVVILEKGTRWFLAPGVRVEVNGTLVMNGTGPNPVFIRPAGDGAHKGIAVNGAEGSRAVISGLQMSGGGGKDGMLVFRNTAVTLSKCTLNGGANALVSVQRGTVDISGSTFTRTDGDCVRLSNCEGKVEACTFEGSADGVAGNGLVVVAGKLTLVDCEWQEFRSVGLSVSSNAEVSSSEGEVSGCATGVEVLDGARLKLQRTKVLRNAVGLAARRTQQHRKGGTITLVGCRFEGNTKDQDLDSVSKVTEEGVQ